jgi:hypothetical protein
MVRKHADDLCQSTPSYHRPCLLDVRRLRTAPKIDNTRNYDATFVCDGTKVMKVGFTPFATTLASDGVSADLTQQPADGLLYTGGGQRLQAHGNEATWTDNKGVSHRCREHAGETDSNMPSR